MRIAVLGPLEVRTADGTVVDVRGGRLRALVTRLALDANHPVGLRTLVDALWDDDPPAAVGNALQSLVSRLRTALGSADTVRSGPAGYTLAGVKVDAAEFEALVALARNAPPERAIELLDEAVALWRGEALADVRELPFAQAPAARLDDLRLAASEDRALALLRLGRPGEAVADAAALAASHPLRERTHELLIRALHASGRQTDALAAYDGLRTRLADQLGVDPSSRLRDLHTAVLRDEPIDPVRRKPAPQAPSPAPPNDPGSGPTPTTASDPAARAGLHPAAGPASDRATGSASDQAARSASGQATGSASDEVARSALGPAAGNASGSPADPETDGLPPNNLRERVTSFVGRDDDVAAIGKLLAGSRLVTLVGPGGAGKTRLAAETARTLGAQSPDGIWFVELAPLADPADIAPAVLAVLGASEIVSATRTGMVTVRSARERLLEVLADRPVMLVLDNCEHLIAAVADLTDTLLGGCRRLRVLATSREPLGIPGEQLYPVGPLGLPPDDGADLSPYAAIQLFVDRGLAVRPDFALTASNSPAVKEVCRRLDGMPLAIELAAARLRSMNPEQIVERLADRFRLLITGSRTALPRHQTLRAVVEWSWDLLDDAERAVARRLAVFQGGATLKAAERVCAGAPADDVLTALASLVDKSLVEAGTGPAGVRYRMLETVKAFAAERLDEAGETEAVRREHAAYFCDLAETAEPKLRTGEQVTWITRMTADHDNLLAALRLTIDSGDADRAIRLVSVLGQYWNLRGRPAESTAWFEAALELPGPTSVPHRALTLFLYALGVLAAEGSERTETVLRRAMRAIAQLRLIVRRNPDPELRLFGAVTGAVSAMIGRDRAGAVAALDDTLDDPDPWSRSMGRMMRAMMAENDGELSQMMADLTAAFDGFHALGDRWGMSLALRGQASYAVQAGEHAAGRDALTESLRLLAELGTLEGVPMLLCQLAQCKAELGDVAGARADLNRARELSAQTGSVDNDTMAAAALGALERREGNLAAARALTEPALTAMAGEVERIAPQGLAMIAAMMARICLAEGNVKEASRYIRRALAPAALSQDMPILSLVVEALADVRLAQDRPELAARTLGMASRLRGMRSVTDQDVRRTVTALRERLGDGGYEAAYDEGAELTRDQSLAELGLPVDPPAFAELTSAAALLATLPDELED